MKIDDVLHEAAISGSGLLLLHGEPGAGKSALLDHARRRAVATGMTVVEARGARPESEYPFAGLHQLLHPLRHHLPALPPAQAEVLSGVLRLASLRPDDMFPVSVAVLALMTEAAREGGLLCLLDDAQWVDQATVNTLLFVARRLRGEGVALLVAQRDPGWDALADPVLPRVRLEGLDLEAATSLLAAWTEDIVDPRVAGELVARTRGNTLALTELGSALSAPQLSGREPLPNPLPLGEGVERAFLDRVRALPHATQLALLVAAAEETGDMAAVLTATARLGLDCSSFDPAEESGVIGVAGRRIVFRHPVVRTAVYSASSFTQRRKVHGALADVLLPEARDGRRAWHLAAAAMGPDEEVAAELADAAEAARSRGDRLSASALWERAAHLTPEVDLRARRLYEASRAAWQSGRLQHTEALIAEAELIVRQPEVLGKLLRLRGTVQLRSGVITEAFRTLSRAAACLAESDPAIAARCLVEAAEAASYGGDLSRCVELGATAGLLPFGSPTVQCTHLLLSGIGAVATGDVRGARELITRGTEKAVALGDPTLIAWAGIGALYLGDGAQALTLYQQVSDLARTSGHLGSQPGDLHFVVALETCSGGEAVALAEEGLRLARKTGQDNLAAVHLSRLALLHALRGDEPACRDAAEEALSVALGRRIGLAVATARYSLAVLALMRGEFAEALHLFELLAASEPGRGHPMVSMLSLPDRIEAAVRAREPESARAAMGTLEAWQAGAESGEARALVARSRALLTDDDEQAIGLFEEALRLHGGHVPVERARTELYLGERLRRARKRVDARRCLRSAADTLDQLDVGPWAERAWRELRATGQTTRRRKEGSGELTPQERRIARLAAAGNSNQEIATQLILSRRTVEYHLYKVFPKLGVASRAELTQLYYCEPTLFD
ncbi:AAA family ATPase [Streptomyces actinomycinicus]|uniref:AAA family ATPase n=1 Tax=Streptomyces actinomycinicus TaxID=1695166 RepID=A0A937EI16_9ACTN|nr:AAA family ATPase [Streptomyces actinomycinicus]